MWFKATVIALIGVTVVLMAGCGDGGENVASTANAPTPSKEWRVTLNSVDGPESVSVLMALHRGFFKDAGLNVWAGSPLEPNRPASYVAKGIDDFGLVQMPQLVIARDEGMPLVALGSVISQPTAAMIWLERSKIGKIADLRGKTIAIPGAPFQKRLLEAVLTRAGVPLENVQIKDVGYNLVGALMSGSADAIFGGSRVVEGVKIKARGANPVITPVQDLGVPAYEELVVVTRNALVAKDPEVVERFISVVLRGSSAAVGDPSGAVDAVVQGLEANPPPNRRVMEAQMAAARPLISKTGHMNPHRARTLVDWMYREGLISHRIPTEELFGDVSQ